MLMLHIWMHMHTVYTNSPLEHSTLYTYIITKTFSQVYVAFLSQRYKDKPWHKYYDKNLETPIFQFKTVT